MATRILSIKSDYNIAEGCIDEIIQLIKEVLPTGNRMLPNFYQTKRLVSQLGCGHKNLMFVNLVVCYFVEMMQMREIVSFVEKLVSRKLI